MSSYDTCCIWHCAAFSFFIVQNKQSTRRRQLILEPVFLSSCYGTLLVLVVFFQTVTNRQKYYNTRLGIGDFGNGKSD